MNNDPMAGLDPEDAEPFAVTPGFIAFLAMLVLPFLLAIVVYAGAAFVAKDVYAADAAEAQRAGAPKTDTSSFNTTRDVAGWKRTLVGVCPLH
jgi:hypothetical protein